MLLSKTIDGLMNYKPDKYSMQEIARLIATHIGTENNVDELAVSFLCEIQELKK